MELLGRQLVFGDRQQMLVCKWIDDDMKQFGKIKYIEQNYSEGNEQLISDYHLLEIELRSGKDKYLKSLTKVKM